MSYHKLPPVYSVATAGATIAVPAFDGPSQKVLLNPAGLLATLTFTFPTAADGQEIVISSTQIVTALTLTPASGSFLNILSALAVNTPAAWTWSATASQWFRTR